jgi:enoyl-CoA hydratase
MDAQLVKVDAHGSVRVLMLDRPPVNALNGALIDAIGEAVDETTRDDAVRAVVVYGGRRVFSAGADLRELSGVPPEARRAWIARGARLCDRIAALDKPSVAAIEGYCLGGGLELAMACHVRVAAATARLGQPEVKLGILPGFGGTTRLPRLVPTGVATELLLTGEPIDAKRAEALGLVNRVAPSGGALEAALALAELLAARSPMATAAILGVLRGATAELDAVVAALAAPDGREGIAAFLEKRAARFGGAG